MIVSFKKKETVFSIPFNFSGVGGFRTLVQTKYSQAFYMFSSLLIVGKTTEMNIQYFA